MGLWNAEEEGESIGEKRIEIRDSIRRNREVREE
jgi:hypothetical protein